MKADGKAAICFRCEGIRTWCGQVRASRFTSAYSSTVLKLPTGDHGGAIFMSIIV